MHYISDLESIYNAAKAILRQEIQAASPAPLKLRLMGQYVRNITNYLASDIMVHIAVFFMF